MPHVELTVETPVKRVQLQMALAVEHHRQPAVAAKQSRRWCTWVCVRVRVRVCVCVRARAQQHQYGGGAWCRVEQQKRPLAEHVL